MNVPFYEIKKSDIAVKPNVRAIMYPPHIHDEIEIIYVIEGKQKIAIGDRQYCVNAGEAAVILPEQVHEFIREKDIPRNNSEATSVTIIANTKIFNGLFPDFHKYRMYNPVVSADRLDKKAKAAFMDIFENKNETTAVYGWFCVALNYIFKTVIMEKTETSSVEGTVAKIMNYIADNFTENINLETVSEHFGLSKYYISHIFSEKLNVNFRTYIGMLRAEYAARLIRTTDHTMTEIATISGFDTQRTFNRVFIKVYGMTPTQYRKNIINAK